VFTDAIQPRLRSSGTLVVHGPEATGKTGLLKSYLDISGLKHAFIPCSECITGRHFLERTLAACVEAIELATNVSLDGVISARCENLSTLTSSLERLLEGIDKFVLVLDGIDEQRDAPPTLLPTLARLGQLIPCLSVVMVVTFPHPRLLHLPGAPHIYFSPYTREQAIQIACCQPQRIFNEPLSPSANYSEELAAEDDAWLWSRFCAAVWDSLASGAARDIVAFRSILDKLWRPFVQPIVDNTYGTRDFSKLMVAQRKLFQAESCLLDSVIDEPQADTNMLTDGMWYPLSSSNTCTDHIAVTHDLPYYSKWLLCAAYLASFNPPRQDNIYFMKATERKRRRKGGGAVAGRESKNRKIPRHLLSPSPFPLDRLLAILQAVLPHDLTPTIDVYTQLATLCSLRLLLRTAVVGGDVLEPGAKWKVNFGWEYALKLARSVNFDITDHVAE
jgi:origin recognition complex subunit 5